LDDARMLTLKAAEHLEDAVSLEELRHRHSPKTERKAAS
jgi:hypothetical protein